MNRERGADAHMMGGEVDAHGGDKMKHFVGGVRSRQGENRAELREFSHTRRSIGRKGRGTEKRKEQPGSPANASSTQSTE